MAFNYKFHVKKKRPEDIYADVRDYYIKDRLLDYAYSKSMMRIQEKITKRVLELLDFENNNKLILDAGCGPGFASFYLNRTNRSGIIEGGPIGGKYQAGKWKIDARFNRINLTERIKKISYYRNRIRVVNYDGLELLKKYHTRNNFFILFNKIY